MNSQEPYKNNIFKMNSELVFEIKLHGFLLWASMGFFMPVAILAIRMSPKFQEFGKTLKFLYYVHVISQIVSVVIVTAAAVMSIKKFNNSFNNLHQRIGVGLYAIIWLQLLTGILRPNRGCKGRSVWFFAHWLLGTTVTLLGIINTYTGLVAYQEKTSGNIKTWAVLFTLEVSCLSIFYLLQDKLVYAQTKPYDSTTPSTHIHIHDGNPKGSMTSTSC